MVPIWTMRFLQAEAAEGAWSTEKETWTRELQSKGQAQQGWRRREGMTRPKTWRWHHARHGHLKT